MSFVEKSGLIFLVLVVFRLNKVAIMSFLKKANDSVILTFDAVCEISILQQLVFDIFCRLKKNQTIILRMNGKTLLFSFQFLRKTMSKNII